MAWTEITRRKYRRDGDALCKRFDGFGMGFHRAAFASRIAAWPPARDRSATRLECDLVYGVHGAPVAPTAEKFPPYSTVQSYFYAWSREGVLAAINHCVAADADFLKRRDAGIDALIKGATASKWSASSSIR
jgi:hypothetical protein